MNLCSVVLDALFSSAVLLNALLLDALFLNAVLLNEMPFEALLLKALTLKALPLNEVRDATGQCKTGKHSVPPRQRPRAHAPRQRLRDPNATP